MFFTLKNAILLRGYLFLNIFHGYRQLTFMVDPAPKQYDSPWSWPVLAPRCFTRPGLQKT